MKGNYSHSDRYGRRRYFVAEVAPATWQPNVDVYQTEDAVVVIVEIPGINPELVDISIDGRILHLSGSRVPHCRPGYRQFYQLEVSQGAFERVVRLPTPVEGSGARAEYHDGFLEIVLPISQAVRPPISVRTLD
ncbi:MAG: Hsp20/alpha crystallin family protein [Chloroflexota bacterium]|nr:Hsp20/alpha crystallin family protein [Chloroflexota bacterium]